MSKWYEIPHDERSPEQKKAARIAHYNTFLKDVEGQQCLADMRRRELVIAEMAFKLPEYAFVSIVLGTFMRETRDQCGPSDMLEVIKKEAEVARRTVPDVPERSAPDGYDPQEFRAVQYINTEPGIEAKG